MSEEPKESTKQSGELQMDFATFILSLNASSMIHMGEIPDPQSMERSVNLPAAKHTIEILEIIENKTQGNLDETEKKLLEDILYNLRMKFMQNSPKEG
jgi:vacuolar-type H+-ATPase subunit C/Vma6